VAHYYACKFGVNRLRIDGDIRQKAAITAIMENLVIYQLRSIQQWAARSLEQHDTANIIMETYSRPTRRIDRRRALINVPWLLIVTVIHSNFSR